MLESRSTMSFKKFIGLLLLALFIYIVIQNPNAAAGIVEGIWGIFKTVATSFGEFVSRVF
jgi:hypothetical protein